MPQATNELGVVMDWEQISEQTWTRSVSTGVILVVAVASDLGARVQIDLNIHPEIAKRVANAMVLAGLSELMADEPIPFSVVEPPAAE